MHFYTIEPKSTGAGPADTRSTGVSSTALGFRDRNNPDDPLRGGGASGNTNRFSSDRDRFSTSGGSRNTDGGRGSRPPSFNNQPGLFRPISTDFNDRDQFNNIGNEDSGNFGSNAFNSGTRDSDRFGSSNTGRFVSGSTNRFPSTDSGRFDTSNNDRLRSSTRNNFGFGGGRFSGTGADNNLFGITAGSDSGTGAFGSSGFDAFGSGSGASFGSGGAGGLSTSSLGTVPGEGSSLEYIVLNIYALFH